MSKTTKQDRKSALPKPAAAKPGTQRLDGKTGELTETQQDGSTVTIAPPAPAKVKPSLRGKSVIEAPVDYVWEKADFMFADARAKGQPAPKRKDVVAACVADGVAPYTARTQYQLWHQHTQGGKKLMIDGNARPVKRVKSPVAAPAGAPADTDGEADEE